jgi:Protein of unknown function (DUF3800)
MPVYVLYVDESGVPVRRLGTTSHYALAGVAIPAATWISKRAEIAAMRAKYGFPAAEIHVAWMLRPYPEQVAITKFEALTSTQRRDGVNRIRAATLATVRTAGLRKKARELEAFNRKTSPYVHLTMTERRTAALEIAGLVGSWGDVALFGEVLDKSIRSPFSADDSAYEQVLTRFEAFLLRKRSPGIVAYDANESVVERFTTLMARFQDVGGIWRQFRHITGHPFFVPSHMSDLIQVADVVSYGLRRYAENAEWGLLGSYFHRFDRVGARLVGLRHYRGGRRCRCRICLEPR